MCYFLDVVVLDLRRKDASLISVAASYGRTPTSSLSQPQTDGRFCDKERTALISVTASHERTPASSLSQPHTDGHPPHLCHNLIRTYGRFCVAAARISSLPRPSNYPSVSTIHLYQLSICTNYPPVPTIHLYQLSTCTNYLSVPTIHLYQHTHLQPINQPTFSQSVSTGVAERLEKIITYRTGKQYDLQ
ncbi:hypothetical protein Pcinc_034984 [Petrolisthes cinctipes]|uniref:Uncharacterized protein n=1 Tax=Petrolisthes cinctipes TaxID=88211 RepID=A0AAE1EPY6_PETCI|nr:hypothetical protein Pcinc_034984 [Petrolisthes cinctipes]